MYQALLFFIHRTPFFIPFLGLCLGILLQEYFCDGNTSSIFLASTGLVLHILYYFLPQRKRYQWQSLLPFIYLLFFIAGGQVLLAAKDIRTHKNWIGKLEIDPPNSILELVIETSPVEKTNSTQVVASAYALHRGRSQTACGW